MAWLVWYYARHQSELVAQYEAEIDARIAVLRRKAEQDAGTGEEIHFDALQRDLEDGE